MRRASSIPQAVDVSADSPASPDAVLSDTSGVEDRRGWSLPCLNLDELSSSDDDAVGPVDLGDLSVTVLCGSDDYVTLLIQIRSSPMWTYRQNRGQTIRDR